MNKKLYIMTKQDLSQICMVKIQKIHNTKAGENAEQQKLSFIASTNAKWYNHFGRQFDSFLQS